jgi:hypothetical protein
VSIVEGVIAAGQKELKAQGIVKTGLLQDLLTGKVRVSV